MLFVGEQLLNIFHTIFSPISREQQEIENAMLILSVKDRDLFGISNQYVAECYITFAEIKRTDGVQQIHLALNRPKTTGLFTIFNLNSNIQIPKDFDHIFYNCFRMRLRSCIGIASR